MPFCSKMALMCRWLETMTGRLGVIVIIGGACLILVPAFGWAGSILYDLGGVLCVVAGALALAMNGEAADVGGTLRARRSRRRPDEPAGPPTPR